MRNAEIGRMEWPFSATLRTRAAVDCIPERCRHSWVLQTKSRFEPHTALLLAPQLRVPTSVSLSLLLPPRIDGVAALVSWLISPFFYPMVPHACRWLHSWALQTFLSVTDKTQIRTPHYTITCLAFRSASILISTTYGEKGTPTKAAENDCIIYLEFHRL